MSNAAAVSYTAAQLPGIRNRVIEDLEKPEGLNMALDVYQLHLLMGLQAPADPREADPRRQARLLIRGELNRLRQASLYWVSPEMTQLTAAAAPRMPVFYPRPEDLPSPSGLIYFAAPLAGYEPWDLIRFTDGSETEAPARSAPEHQICAASWGPWNRGGQWKRGGTWFTFYTIPLPSTQSALGLTAADLALLNAHLPPLVLDNEAVCPADPADYPAAERPYAEAALASDSTMRWAHQVLCAFRLMETARMIRASEQPIPRAIRKLSQRAKVAQPDKPVRLVDIAAGVVHREQHPQNHAGDRTYRCRWIVSGHWRNQWYPATQVHRPRWIDAHQAGPADAPLKVRETVNVFRDGSDQMPGSAE